jgi:hypothetical protein
MMALPDIVVRELLLSTSACYLKVCVDVIVVCTSFLNVF